MPIGFHPFFVVQLRIVTQGQALQRGIIKTYRHIRYH